MLAYSRRETQEIERDPVRLLFAFLGSALMMLAFGFGITTDVENIRFAYLDLDQSPESRAYLAELRGLAVTSSPTRRPRPRKSWNCGSNRTRSRSPSRCSPISAATSTKATWARSPPGSTARRPNRAESLASTSSA